jgi:Tol biopolymer transport system component
VVKEVGEWGDPRISPNGNRALAAKLQPDGERANIWLVDASGDAAALTDGVDHQGSPVWAPDGARFAFFQQGRSAGNSELYAQGITAGSRPQLLVSSDTPKYPTDWSRDGRYLLFTTLNPGSSSDIWALSSAEHRAGPILGTVANEGCGALSPDRQWLAFQSDRSGQAEVYVQRFAGIEGSARRQWQVSSGGGGRPRWRADGKELYYITSQGRLMAVTVHAAAGEFTPDAPHVLFQTHPVPKTWNLYDVSPDGRRFLLNLPLELANSTSIGVLTGWTQQREQAEGRERLPAKRPNGSLHGQ